MNQITILKKVIAEQAILINKLQAHLVDTIPKKPSKSNKKLTMAEARILVNKMIERQQKKNN